MQRVSSYIPLECVWRVRAWGRRWTSRAPWSSRDTGTPWSTWSLRRQLLWNLGLQTGGHPALPAEWVIQFTLFYCLTPFLHLVLGCFQCSNHKWSAEMYYRLHALPFNMHFKYVSCDHFVYTLPYYSVTLYITAQILLNWSSHYAGYK